MIFVGWTPCEVADRRMVIIGWTPGPRNGKREGSVSEKVEREAMCASGSRRRRRIKPAQLEPKNTVSESQNCVGNARDRTCLSCGRGNCRVVLGGAGDNDGPKNIFWSKDNVSMSMIDCLQKRSYSYVGGEGRRERGLAARTTAPPLVDLDTGI